MNLAEVEHCAGQDAEAPLDPPHRPWEDFPPSQIADHGSRCCALAKQWFFAMDRSQRGPDTTLGPRWIRDRVSWGPTCWPFYWCDAVRAKVLDCGALAALAVAAYTQRGVASYTAQLVQRYSRQDAGNWLRTWERENAHTAWIDDDLVYHEACAVMSNGRELRLWDPTGSWWVDPRQFAGYSAVLAIRVLVRDATSGADLVWGDHRLPANRWHPLQSARVHVLK